MNNSTHQLLTYKNMGAITIDINLRIKKIDPSAATMLAITSSHMTDSDICDLLPELIGNEKTIIDIVKTGKKNLQLDFINRQVADQSIVLNLFIFPDDIAEQGLVIIEDVSELAHQLQELNQQRYELLLYKNSAAFRNAFLNQGILGTSPAIQQVREAIAQVSAYPKATVLLMGESGTGKNLVARVLHYSSMPADSPLVDINCAALPSNLIESELFGYEKGAFTHATSTRAGLFEEAQGGTILLDEIGELHLNLQAKLLSVLETKRFRRLGSNKEVEVDTRIIAATNRNLAEDVAQNKFRQDLYYRLNVVNITLPPLRELENDVLIIANHFLKIFNVEFKKHVNGFTSAAEEMLLRYTWPGNVRELSNCIERAMIFAESAKLDAADLIISPQPSPVSKTGDFEIPPDGISLENVERQLLTSALERSGGNKSKAAKLLGLTRDTLRYRLEKFQID